MFTLDRMRKHPRCHNSGIVKVPQGLSIEAATSTLHPNLLAYHALVNVAQLGEEDSILIHLAASSVGQAAVCLAQKQKTRVYATVESSEDTLFVSQKLGVPHERISDVNDVSFEALILRATNAFMLDECTQTMPPIKGCINAAMVLQDGIVQENMTFAKWDLAMRSKVQTS
ncbi:Acyl transferase/acyl hydrolase/lysophospholipase [Penicillium malachiteum]|nr:Acyl transferase/acyl hydrolase/lysophospholipase [Penicillium malachiteum]